MSCVNDDVVEKYINDLVLAFWTIEPENLHD